MDFFEQQRRARRRTGWLILLFIVAVFFVGVSVHVGVMTIMFFADPSFNGPYIEGLWTHPESLTVFIISQICVTVLVCLGSLTKIYSLSQGGGEYVAETLGGKEISPFTLRFEEKQLLNIVEEMSISAGIIVPAVYILERERRINSFTAGFDQDSAVIGITRGALDYLTRDEIQAIVAHEFSHILNGDMLLNMRMIGVLYGLGMVTQVGLAFSLTNPDLQEHEDLPLFTMLMFHPFFVLTFCSGFLFALLGTVGWLLGAAIKAAITRQRKYLADASAIQFTRNSGALKSAFIKIGCRRVGSLVYSAYAFEASHIFLGSAMYGGTSGWNPFASHPSWTARIRRIDPRFRGIFPESVPRIKRYGNDAVTGVADSAMIDELLRSTNPRLGRFFARERIANAREKKTVIPESTLPPVTKIPDDKPKTVELPPLITESLRTKDGCLALFYALLLDKEAEYRSTQLEELADILSEAMLVHVKKISTLFVESFSVEQTMAKTSAARKLRSAFIRIRNRTLDEGLPILRTLTVAEYAEFRRIAHKLTGDVNKINLFRYTLFAAFRNGLDKRFHYGKSAKPVVQIYSVAGVEPSLKLALSYLAYAGHSSREEAESAFEAGLRTIGLYGTLLPISDCVFRTLDESLRHLQTASPQLREKIVTVFQTCLWHDGVMTAREEEIFLAVRTMLA
jgi:Zn-dependent protease with chaperone function